MATPWSKRRPQWRIKRAFDIAGASAALVATAPITLAVSAAIWRRMGRPILFRQPRPGFDGEVFMLWKFRTMTPETDELRGVESDGHRLTALGKALRNWSLDELPTLLNVLRGEMSLVGPRPLLVEYLDKYSAEQRRRHQSPPGVTGWAQIHGRNAIDWDTKLALDVWYVDNWSLLLDLSILLRTVAKVLRREGIAAPGSATMPTFTGPASSATTSVGRT